MISNFHATIFEYHQFFFRFWKGICLSSRNISDNLVRDGFRQPRSQGLSSLPPLSLRKDNDNGGREQRLWERGWGFVLNFITTTEGTYSFIESVFVVPSCLNTWVAATLVSERAIILFHGEIKT